MITGVLGYSSISVQVSSHFLYVRLEKQTKSGFKENAYFKLLVFICSLKYLHVPQYKLHLPQRM